MAKLDLAQFRDRTHRAGPADRGRHPTTRGRPAAVGLGSPSEVTRTAPPGASLGPKSTEKLAGMSLTDVDPREGTELHCPRARM